MGGANATSTRILKKPIQFRKMPTPFGTRESSGVCTWCECDLEGSTSEKIAVYAYEPYWESRENMRKTGSLNERTNLNYDQDQDQDQDDEKILSTETTPQPKKHLDNKGLFGFGNRGAELYNTGSTQKGRTASNRASDGGKSMRSGGGSLEPISEMNVITDDYVDDAELRDSGDDGKISQILDSEFIVGKSSDALGLFKKLVKEILSYRNGAFVRGEKVDGVKMFSDDMRSTRSAMSGRSAVSKISANSFRANIVGKKKNQGVVRMHTKGVVLIRMLAPNVCEVTMVQNVRDGGKVPASIINNFVATQLNLVNFIQSKYERSGAEVDSEIAQHFVTAIPRNLQLVNDEQHLMVRKMRARIDR